MIRLIRSKRALSNVVTTLIILVVAVLLATVVVDYAINVVSTRVQEENLQVQKEHVWVNATAAPGTVAYAQAALIVLNTGGRDVVISEVAARGQACPWNQTGGTSQKFVLYCVTNIPIIGDLSYVDNFNYTAGNSTAHVINRVLVGTKMYNFTVANTEVILKSGDALMIYIVNPDSVSVNDVGLTIGITLHSAQAIYYEETNVQAATP
jgi:hypothetical protein